MLSPLIGQPISGDMLSGRLSLGAVCSQRGEGGASVLGLRLPEGTCPLQPAPAGRPSGGPGTELSSQAPALRHPSLRRPAGCVPGHAGQPLRVPCQEAALVSCQVPSSAPERGQNLPQATTLSFLTDARPPPVPLESALSQRTGDMPYGSEPSLGDKGQAGDLYFPFGWWHVLWSVG